MWNINIWFAIASFHFYEKANRGKKEGDLLNISIGIYEIAETIGNLSQ